MESHVDGDFTDLPAGIDLTVYRIVQEALTNALRHARTRAVVRVAREPGRVVVEVHNPVAAAGGPSSCGAGQGLPGMRERVRVYGGDIVAGPVGDDWVVRAELPLAAADR